MAPSAVSKSPTTAAAGGLDVEDLDSRVVRLFAMVSEGLAAATSTFLAADRDAARVIVAGDVDIDALHLAVEAFVRQAVVTRTATEAELTLLLAVLQIVPEVERSGDLVQHIANRASSGLGRRLTPRARGAIAEMGRLGVQMWRAAAVAYLERDATAARRLRLLDDTLDDLHVSLTEELASADMAPAVAIELGLVARFFERVGDHAVNVTRRLEPLTEASR